MASTLAPTKARRGIRRLGIATHAKVNNTFVLLSSVNSWQTLGSNSLIPSGTAQLEPNTMCSCEEKILVIKTQGALEKAKNHWQNLDTVEDENKRVDVMPFVKPETSLGTIFLVPKPGKKKVKHGHITGHVTHNS